MKASFESGRLASDEGRHHVFMDGSKEATDEAGLGFVIRGENCIVEGKAYVGMAATVFQTEALAILEGGSMHSTPWPTRPAGKGV